MQAQSPHKPSGGITAVALTPAGNFLRAERSGEAGVKIVLRDATKKVDLPLLDERSSYEELSDTQAGPLRIRHKLVLVLNREVAQTLLTPDFRRSATSEGALAWITMNSGEQLVAGWSADWGIEQSLRLNSVVMASGTKPLDGTPVVATFTSEDTTPAVELKE